MNKSSFNRFTLDWYQMGLTEYIILVNPDENVYEKVMCEKENFHDKFAADIAIKTLPHITLANILAKAQIENLLCDCLESICKLQHSFTVALKNFGGFRPHTIYINILRSGPFNQLINNMRVLDRILGQNGCPPLHLATKLHMTIARNLEEWIYNKAIIEYIERSFSEIFTLIKLTLLKRNSRYKKWEKVGDFFLPTERTLFN